jgi:fatty acid synthase subunit alpha, fungi type
MAVRTLKAKYEARYDSTGLFCRVFCVSKGQELYHKIEDKPEATSEPDVPPEAAIPSPAPVAAAPAVVTPPLVPTVAAGPATSIEDAPIRAVDILAAIVSQKLKKQLNEFPLSEFIEDLSNGKSTLQNEIMGDLQGEFSPAPDKGEEPPLEALGDKCESPPL